jgi:photoactive yellow protein
MMTITTPGFDEAELAARLDTMTQDEFDDLDFGVIAIDDQTRVCVYNAAESRIAGLSPGRVLGSRLFEVVAPCMNNFMVAQRFADAAAARIELDVVIDYVLTLRMLPLKVRLRLVATPGSERRYVLVQRVV